MTAIMNVGREENNRKKLYYAIDKLALRITLLRKVCKRQEGPMIKMMK